jgi:hypothetical protein
MLSERTATPCPKVALQTCIDNVLANRPDLLSFIQQLEQVGVTCQPNIASTGKMNGFSFEFRGIAFKASQQLGKRYAWSNIQTLIDYSPGHVKLLNTQSKSAPAPCKQPEAHRPSRETILDKLLQLDEQVRNERESELAHTIQLHQKLHFTAHQISRQHQSHFRCGFHFLASSYNCSDSWIVLCCMRPLVPLDKSIIFTYLPPLLNLAMKYIQNNWLAKDPTTNHISNSLFLQFSQEIIDRLYRSIIQL